MKFGIRKATIRRATKRKSFIQAKGGRVAKVVAVANDIIIVKLNNNERRKINANWRNNSHPNRLYRRSDMSDTRNNLAALQHPDKVYNVWTPFKLNKIVHVKLDKDGVHATFIKAR